MMPKRCCGRSSILGAALALLFVLLAQEAFAQDYIPNQVVVLYKASTSRRSSAGSVSAAAQPVLVNLAPGETVAAALARLRKDPKVAVAEPNFIVRGSDGEEVGEVDEEWTTRGEAASWGLNKVAAPASWKVFTEEVDTEAAAEGAKICVIDSGIDCKHPDLKDRCVDGFNALIGKRGIAAASDDNGHGTQVAGVVAASSNSAGVVGVNPGAALYSCKFMNEAGVGTIFDANKCLQWCISVGAGISVNAWGSDGSGGAQTSATLRRTLVSARGKKHLFITSAGNANKTLGPNGSMFFPAMLNLPNMIIVGATSRTDRPAVWSRFGTNYNPNIVDIGAPGVSVITADYTLANENSATWYRSVSGSSIATGFVGGAAGLIQQALPEAQTEEVRTWILQGADQVNALRKHFAQGRRLNVNKALMVALGLMEAPPLPSPSAKQAGSPSVKRPPPPKKNRKPPKASNNKSAGTVQKRSMRI